MIKRETLEPLEKEDIINIFVEFSNRIEEEMQLLRDDIKELKEENRQLKNQQNSRNSSRPPSQDFGKVPRQKSLRKKSGKKPGGQAGHKGHTLKQVSSPDNMIVHQPSNTCPACGEVHITEDYVLHSKRQVVDIPPIKANVTEHQVYKAKCKCGHVSIGSFPSGVNGPVQYGKNLTSFVSYLSTRQYVPYQRIPELLKCISDISISEGTVFNMLNKVADKLYPIYESIKTDIKNAKVVGSDETGTNVNNNKYWTWTWQTATETFITVSPTRGFAAIENEFPQGLPNAVLVSDSLSAQLKTRAHKHQLCLAHLLRELNAFIEVTKNKWPVRMKELFMKAINFKKNLCQSQYSQSLKMRDEILQEFQKLLDSPPKIKLKKLAAFHKRMVKWKNSVFTFLFFPEVPFDNNGSERAIRNIKVKQKVSGGFRSENGADIFATIRSVIDTWIKRDKDVFGTLCSYL
ncbi:IS66 family transposase [Saccharicrinis sp. GN24d3]|uniref:IS66 family transposase n=1 Tax=Saccharicrinis sp. GN24d3 TaxID=3458416 RepID=UPI0040360042